MERRGFLAGLAALVAAPWLPRLAAAPLAVVEDAVVGPAHFSATVRLTEILKRTYSTEHYVPLAPGEPWDDE